MPSVDSVLTSRAIRGVAEEYTRELVVNLIREHIEGARSIVRNGGTSPSAEEVAASVVESLAQLNRAYPQPVINATGVIIHTNLGRAPVSLETIEAMLQASEGYTNLELDLESGKRGSRQGHVEPLLRQLTGAEASLVVNNNASAILLGLSALAQGKEVIVSRGEEVEIGGGFRIPEVLLQSGAALVEVGTTNRTYAEDYLGAITENTAALLKVHASNFRIDGFAHAAQVSELAEIGNRFGLPVLHDVGSGCMLNAPDFDLAYEPTPKDSIAGGASLVFFSGDKLLGGPQSGIIVGKQELVRKLTRHPLARAIRIDKVSLAGLTATLRHYIREEAVDKIPIWRMINTSLGELEDRAYHWQAIIGSRATVVRGRSTVGGGSLPGETLGTWVIALECDELEGTAQGVISRLRGHNPPVIGRIEDDQVMLDPRTVFLEEEETLLRSVREAVGLPGTWWNLL